MPETPADTAQRDFTPLDALKPGKSRLATMQRVADALDAPERGRELVRQLRERIGALSARAARASDRPRTACVEWIDKLMSARNWMPELVTLAGGTPLLGEAGAHSPWM